MGKVAQLYESTEPVTGKREAILNAALQLFTEFGFHGTAMPQVAERAGVGAGTIYRYFTSKEALVNTLYRDWKEFQIAEILRDVPPATPLREQFSIYWHRLVDFAMEFPVAFGFLELHFHASYLDEQSREVENRGQQAMVGYFKECLKLQIVKNAQAEFLGSMVIGAYVGMIKASRAGCFTLNKNLITQAEVCCWDAIKR